MAIGLRGGRAGNECGSCDVHSKRIHFLIKKNPDCMLNLGGLKEREVSLEAAMALRLTREDGKKQ